MNTIAREIGVILGIVLTALVTVVLGVVAHGVGAAPLNKRLRE